MKHIAHEIDRSRQQIISVSGGKDSTATLLKALEEYEKEQLIVIFNDTGWEHPATYQYLDYLESVLDLKIQHLKPKDNIDLPNLIRKMKRFPHPSFRFCTETLKQTPFMNFIQDNKMFDSTNWVGVRRAESIARRKKYLEVNPNMEYPVRMFYTSYTYDLKRVRMRFPVVDLNVQEVFEYIKSKKIDVNPLYKTGHTRVGCYPCLLSSKKDIMRLLTDPVGLERIDKLIKLEEEIGCKYNVIDLVRMRGQLDDLGGFEGVSELLETEGAFACKDSVVDCGK